MSAATVSSLEVAELLKRAACGAGYMKLDGPSWDEVFDGTVAFWIDGQRVSFYLEGGKLDHAETACWTDGRTGNFTTLSDPIDLLSEDELDDVETMLRCVSVLCCDNPQPLLN